jgi:asparagine synthase (glutamine-hydrolysing)
MCGIACIYNPSKPIAGSILEAMVAQLHYRGPNARGVAIEDNGKLGLGNTRLSLVDISERSNMPMKKNGIVLTYNGEIYNFKDLREQLQKEGYVFTTTSDTEVIIQSYKKWGLACLQYFNGCFAFCLYDCDQRRLLIARDQFGEKPLLYTTAANGDWLFASEAKALFSHPQVQRELNLDSIISTMIFGSYGDQDMTHFQGVNFLPAGHAMVFDLTKPRHKPQVIKYSKLDTIKPQQYTEEDLPELAQTYTRLLAKSVERKLGADVPLAATLSGGLDSSLMSMLAAPRQHLARNTKLDCFSVKYARNRNLDLSYARLLCDSSPYLQLHEVAVSSLPTLQHYAALTRVLESPVYDVMLNSVFENYRQVQRHGFKGALNGQGTDELWLGYYHLDDFYRLPSSEYTEDHMADHWYQTSPFSDYFQKGIAERAKVITHENIRRNLMPYMTDDILHTLMWFSIRTHLQSVFVAEDKLSMASSIELRLPYVDLELFAFALQFPSRLKILNGKEKYPVRMSAKDILPEGILTRKKKGFPHPSKGYYEQFLQSIDVGDMRQSQILSTLFPEDFFTKTYAQLPQKEKCFIKALSL